MITACASPSPAATTAKKAYSQEEIRRVADDFTREGWAVIPGVLTASECEAFRAEIDRIWREVPYDSPEQGYGQYIRVKLFHYSRLLLDHVDYSPVIDVAEAVLGDTCHLIANNCVRNDKTWAITNWHCDEGVLFPLPEGVEHDDRVVIPCFSLNSQWYLSDVGPDDGPTQVVPYSHRAGRQPPKVPEGEMPVYRGHQGFSAIVRAGDVLLQHAQVWHRGAPVRSDRTRYLLQYSYGRRSFSQRFHPFVNYQLPPQVVEDATPRRLRILGFHKKGPWG